MFLVPNQHEDPKTSNSHMHISSLFNGEMDAKSGQCTRLQAASSDTPGLDLYRQSLQDAPLVCFVSQRTSTP